MKVDWDDVLFNVLLGSAIASFVLGVICAILAIWTKVPELLVNITLTTLVIAVSSLIIAKFNS